MDKLCSLDRMREPDIPVQPMAPRAQVGPEEQTISQGDGSSSGNYNQDPVLHSQKLLCPSMFTGHSRPSSELATFLDTMLLKAVELPEVPTPKRQGPGDHGVEKYSQTPYIHCRAVIALPQEEFRGSNVPGQLHLGEPTFINGVEDLVVVNMRLLVSRDGHEALPYARCLLTIWGCAGLGKELANVHFKVKKINSPGDVLCFLQSMAERRRGGSMVDTYRNIEGFCEGKEMHENFLQESTGTDKDIHGFLLISGLDLYVQYPQHSFWSRVRMSVWTPPRLLELAGMNLLREEASAFSGLEDPPTELFSPLFMEVFEARCIETLKAMVLAWPFVHLPLGNLIDMPHVGPLQAELEALDILFAQKLCPSANFRCRIYRILVRTSGACGLEPTLMDAEEAEVHCNACENIMKVLNMVHLDCIQEVQVNCPWHLSTLAMFAPFLGQMSNFQRLILSHIHMLHHLWDLYLESPSLLEGCLDQMLRLTESDLIHLSLCPNISQLKGLDLSGVTLTDFSPELLQVLLEKVCGIMGFQFEAILPALSHCSQLRSFSLCGNLLSMAVMEKLLLHTTGLPCLSQELYPAPQESYSPQGILLEGRLAQLGAKLFEILRDLSQPRTIWLSLSPCPHYDDDICNHMAPIIYCCNTHVYVNGKRNGDPGWVQDCTGNVDPGRAVIADSGYDPGHEYFSRFYQWVYKFQFLAFACAEKGFTAKSKPLNYLHTFSFNGANLHGEPMWDVQSKEKV
ncbi:hypothetical protein E2I00_015513 [Balaenoptera physalus]|uniref:Uncharacterized protein n=1 Tax=Balaenoptera physalus TaxID=9770 RepID=A0A643BXD2_BALPH|nr:hypothetical protein E2I00_015513 [Balaenoptera physalus]